jgi:hypothetical protein
MPIDDRTTNRSYQLPNAANQLMDDVARLRAALQAIDADVFARYTKAEVDQKVADLINGSPGALDTLNELAAAMGNDPNFAATITNALANRYTKAEANALLAPKAPLASPTFTGTPAAPTAAVDTSTTQLATCAFVIAQAYLKAATAASTYAALAGATFTGNVAVPSINSGPLAGFRNAIINGNFDIWQRGQAQTGAGYLADRWTTNRSGNTGTISRESFTLGQTSVPNEPTYFYRNIITSVAGASNFTSLSQYIEGVRTFAGQTITVSFWAKADAAKPISVELSQFFGTGGTPSAQVTALGVTKTTLSTSWQKITVTTTLPSISGKTLGTNNDDYLALTIWFNAGSSFNARTNTLGQQSGTFEIAQVQVEPGSVATPFERRPPSTELNLCKRYGQYVPFNMLFYASVASQYMESSITWPEMRKTPSAAALTSDPNTTQAATNNTSNFIARLTPYGGSCILQATVGGSTAYVTGYRSWLDAEL